MNLELVGFVQTDGTFEPLSLTASHRNIRAVREALQENSALSVAVITRSLAKSLSAGNFLSKQPPHFWALIPVHTEASTSPTTF